MPRFEEATWEPNFGAFGGRKSRAAFRYQAYVPDPIAEWTPSLPGDVAAVVSEAERAIVRLALDLPPNLGLESVARRLLRTESVASSRIEGLILSHRRLAKAEAAGDDARDETARSILGNIAAMEQAVLLGASHDALRPDDVLALHRTLLEATATPHLAGEIRTQQNWIGGSGFSPRGAEFVPPPPRLVPDLMEDLCAFMARDDLPPVVQAAIAHAQFETIHPFADGNGRVGRALIHVILRRRGLTQNFLPPVSLVLAGNADAYVKGLTAFRAGETAEWCGMFAAATRAAAGLAKDLAGRIAALQAAWRERSRPRRGSTTEALIDLLPAHPILSLATAQMLTGRSKQAANVALAALEEAGVLRQLSIGKRNRAWEAHEVFELANGFEQELGLGPKAGRRA